MLASIGRRNYTFTAWESIGAATAALHSGAHREAMHLLKTGGLGCNATGVASTWKPQVLNGVFHAGKAKSGDLSELIGQWL